MALKAADKEKLKTTYGFDVDKLIEAITATEEKDFEVPADITVISNADLDTRDANNKTAAKKEGELEGEKKGKELAAKQLKRKLSLPDTVANDLDKVLDAANEQLSKGDAGLKEQINLLQNDKKLLETKVTEAENRAMAAGRDAELISMFPANRTADLTDQERLALVKMNLTIEDDNGTQVVKRNGEVMRHDQTKAPVPVKDAIASLFTEKKWIPDGGTPPGGGRGGGDNPPGGGGTAGVKSASKFQEKFKAENPALNPDGAEYMDALAKHAKDIPDFDWHN